MRCMHESPEQANGQAAPKAPDPDQNPRQQFPPPAHSILRAVENVLVSKIKLWRRRRWDVSHGMDSCVWSDARSYLLAIENTEAKG